MLQSPINAQGRPFPGPTGTPIPVGANSLIIVTSAHRGLQLAQRDRAELTLKDQARMSTQANRILIADDNGPNVELLEAYLAGVDCEIAVAVDGRDTLDKVESFKPDLILLDVMMPKLSGFEVCKKLKADPATRGIMILMVTALNELGDIERAVDAGTDDFLSKPVNKLELLKRVENMLRLRHVTDEVERLRQYIAQMEDRAPAGQA
jgi:two-component system, OmpR family, alkaline phosphatase synthesis response regulator PhoP